MPDSLSNILSEGLTRQLSYTLSGIIPLDIGLLRTLPNMFLHALSSPIIELFVLMAVYAYRLSTFIIKLNYCTEMKQRSISKK